MLALNAEATARRSGGDRVQSVVIIGAGFCGTMLAIHLLRARTPAPLHITLLDQNGEFGRGAAYARREFPYVLNVPASRMSVDAHDRLQFVRFAKRRNPFVKGSDHLPRELYGDYLESLLRSAERQAPAHLNLACVKGQVRAIWELQRDGRLRVELLDGGVLVADDVVLATGNPSPAEPPGAEAIRGHTGYVESAWRLPSNLADRKRVLIVGTGLSMADAVVHLLSQPLDQKLKLYAISRRGLLPHGQVDFQPALIPMREFHSYELRSPRALLHAARERALELAFNGADWREVVAAIRTLAPQIWTHWSEDARRSFLRHIQPYWDIHRHRLSQHVIRLISEARARGILQIEAGSIQTMTPSGEDLTVRWRPRGATHSVHTHVDTVINATGPNYRLHCTTNPLLRSLFEGGQISTDVAASGLRTDANCAVIRADNSVHSHLFYLGPMLRATYWETTATAELRQYAERLAHTLTWGARDARVH